jgi:uncharacterized lipoprotein YmbA
MKPRPIFFLGLSLSAIWLLTGTGCNVIPASQPDTTRYFVLNSAAATPAPGAAVPEKRWALGLRTVEVPEFLHGRSMVVRVAGSEVRLVDEARWAEPLAAGIERVLRENLEARAEVARVIPMARASDEPRDCDVQVRVLRCEGDRAGGVARLVAAVEIYATGPKAERRAREVFTAEIPDWNGKDYAQLAAKLSEAVDSLAGRIVALAAAEKP